MFFRSSSVRVSVSSLKAFLLLNLCVSVYKFRMNLPHSSLPLAFSRRFLMSAGTDMVAYFVKVDTTWLCNYILIYKGPRSVGAKVLLGESLFFVSNPVRTLGRAPIPCFAEFFCQACPMPLEKLVLRPSLRLS
jgi:hypothetical protein